MLPAFIGTGVVIGTSWTHRLARIVVRPLVGSAVTPNHLTTLRLLTGLFACAALIPGERAWDWWAGWLWLLSAFLDRADGELARISDACTESGHRYDYIVDMIVNVGFFFAVGIGLRHSSLGGYAIALGAWTGAALFIQNTWVEILEDHGRAETKTYPGAFGFDLDDLLYLLTPIIWFGWLVPLLVIACCCTTLVMLFTGWRLLRRQPL
jgi:archaetidylinositol phosphate synthase